MLCSVQVAISAARKVLAGAMKTLNSAGASLPETIWNSSVTPSTSRVSPVAAMVSVGAMSDSVPPDTAMPMPLPICPCGPGAMPVPNW